jgi:hypothetical protein
VSLCFTEMLSGWCLRRPYWRTSAWPDTAPVTHGLHVTIVFMVTIWPRTRCQGSHRLCLEHIHVHSAGRLSQLYHSSGPNAHAECWLSCVAMLRVSAHLLWQSDLYLLLGCELCGVAGIGCDRIHIAVGFFSAMLVSSVPLCSSCRHPGVFCGWFSLLLCAACGADVCAQSGCVGNRSP